jgi:AMMECR1 domain-containing protein
MGPVIDTRETAAFPQCCESHLIDADGWRLRARLHGRCFVTLYEHGGLGAGTGGASLRGCIGMLSSDLPPVQLVPNMAMASAFEDPRFPPVSQAELAVR